MGKQTEWTLREVASWTKDESPVSIPSLQRGLVWKPQQVELLWDSILRQFPIGTFTLADSVDGNQPYSLLDGQQRWNAISSGFGVCSSDTQTSRTILWFDLKPELVWDSSKTTRRFFIRATTKAHPWGYLADDDCSRLNTAQKREALKELGFDGKNIYHDGICLSETYPVKSGCPLPLFWFLGAGEKAQNQDEFAQLILERIKANLDEKSFRLKTDEIDEKVIAQYFKVFKAVSNYTVPTIYLEQSIIDRESESEKTVDDQKLTDIEVLFARIGTGGTQITQNELIYSAIKAYWPNYIKEENDRLADLYMPPYSLIMLAFRLALSENKDELTGNLSIKKVRQIAQDKNSNEYKSIEALYCLDNGQSLIDSILKMVDSWLTKSPEGELEVPTILRTSIARNSPDVYLLLMAFASNVINHKLKVSPKDIQMFRAIAFYMHWFVTRKAKLANDIFKATLNHPVEEFPSIIKGILYGYYISGYAIPLLSAEEFGDIFGNNGKVGNGPKWRTWEDGRTNMSWWPLWEKIASEREILLYAQRDYMCLNFPNYDPAKLDMWEEYNRPWDFDHIIPKDWIHIYKAWKKEYSDYCINWRDNNGNMAAIPFEVNRAKSNEPNWAEYEAHSSSLLMDQDVQRFQDLFNQNISQDRKQANLFAQKTFERLIRIYSEVLQLMEPINSNDGEIVSLHPNLDTRKSRLLNIQKQIDGQDIYYECNGKEYPVEKNTDWAVYWLSTGKVTDNGYYAAITMYADDNIELGEQIEIGLRRIPGQSELPDIKISPELLSELNDVTGDFSYHVAEGPWWHIQTLIPFKTDDEKISEYLSKLIQFAEKL